MNFEKVNAYCEIPSGGQLMIEAKHSWGPVHEHLYQRYFNLSGF